MTQRAVSLTAGLVCGNDISMTQVYGIPLAALKAGVTKTRQRLVSLTAGLVLGRWPHCNDSMIQASGTTLAALHPGVTKPTHRWPCLWR
jgi:hypothetical protein